MFPAKVKIIKVKNSDSKKIIISGRSQIRLPLLKVFISNHSPQLQPLMDLQDQIYHQEVQGALQASRITIKLNYSKIIIILMNLFAFLQ